MPRQIRIGVECGGRRKSFAWVRLQDDDDRSISVGFVNNDFVVRHLRSERHVDGIPTTEYVDLEKLHPASARRNPHFTLHGNYLHVRSDKGDHLFQGLTFRDVPPGETSTPLLRLVSKRFEQLAVHHPKRIDEPHQLIGVPLPTPDFSVALQFDLTSAPAAFHQDGRHLDHFITWGGIVLRIQAWAVRGRTRRSSSIPS